MQKYTNTALHHWATVRDICRQKWFRGIRWCWFWVWTLDQEKEEVANQADDRECDEDSLSVLVWKKRFSLHLDFKKQQKWILLQTDISFTDISVLPFEKKNDKSAHS